MKKKYSKPNLLTVIILAITFGILLPTSNVFSQNLLGINEGIGAGTGGTTQQDNKSDNTLLYVAAALIGGGLIAYALLKKHKEKTDSTETKDKSSLIIQHNNLETLNYKIQKAKDEIPVDILLGIRNEKAFISEKTYILGVSVRF